MKVTDKMRLDWLAQQGVESALPWVARRSVTGRGYRLHQDAGLAQGIDGLGDTPREAIDAAIRAAKKPSRKGVRP